MRLCRFSRQGQTHIGFYDEQRIVPLTAAAANYQRDTGETLALPAGDQLIDFLPPNGSGSAAATKLGGWLESSGKTRATELGIPTAETELLVPIPRPNKIFLLAGNYAEHIREGGGVAAERAETFPYVFMKPPTTTLTNPGKPVVIPSVSPNAIDWELELAVVIGRKVKNISEKEALSAVAGYTVINDISNRKFRPNPNRKKRDRDGFFDWLHGKWHDSFCPCGPCITSADAIPDPQTLGLKLKLNGEVKQDGSTGQMIFSVAALIEFISSICTLEPGDLISTGTPAGVGNTTGTYIKAGDVLEAHIDRIGTLVSPVVAE